MRAAVLDAYGGPEGFSFREIAAPEPGVGEVLIRVRAAAVNPIDWKIRRGSLRFLRPARFPLVLGFDAAGEVVAVGPEVSRFAPGDFVFAMLDRPHGGAYAQYAVTSETTAAPLPPTLSFEEAAALPLAGLTALQALRDRGGLTAGERSLIVGAAGGVGHLAVQIAKALGAEVTAVASGRNLPFLWQLGADRTIDSTRAAWTEDDGTFEVVFDAVGAGTFPAAAPLLADHGVYVSTLPGPAAFSWVAKSAFSALWGDRRRARLVVVKPSGDDLVDLARLAALGQLKPAIERVFPLAEVGRAHELSEGGHVRGKLVLAVD